MFEEGRARNELFEGVHKKSLSLSGKGEDNFEAKTCLGTISCFRKLKLEINRNKKFSKNFRINDRNSLLYIGPRIRSWFLAHD